MTDAWPRQLEVRPLTESDAREIAGWRYEGPWDIYSSRSEDGAISLDAGYFAVAGVDGGGLVGFCCSGPEARVPGLAVDETALDVGVGMHPDLVGQGHGLSFVLTVLEHIRATGGARRLRAVVQSWNERSLRLVRSVGFVETGRHVVEQGGASVEYVVVILA